MPPAAYDAARSLAFSWGTLLGCPASERAAGELGDRRGKGAGLTRVLTPAPRHGGDTPEPAGSRDFLGVTLSDTLRATPLAPRGERYGGSCDDGIHTCGDSGSRGLFDGIKDHTLSDRRGGAAAPVVLAGMESWGDSLAPPRCGGGGGTTAITAAGVTRRATRWVGGVAGAAGAGTEELRAPKRMIDAVVGESYLCSRSSRPRAVVRRPSMRELPCAARHHSRGEPPPSCGDLLDTGFL